MLLAIIVSLVVWSSPTPTLWICNPGHGPAGTPSNCEPLHFHVLGKFRVG